MTHISLELPTPPQRKTKSFLLKCTETQRDEWHKTAKYLGFNSTTEMATVVMNQMTEKRKQEQTHTQ